MIEVGTEAPGFTLRDQFARAITLGSFRGRRHVMLLFYPLDFTPNCSREIPQVEALLARFSAARTQVLGLSVDSIYSHAHWGASLGGVSFPLLSDFNPKGEVARSYGLYLAKAGIADRATVLIDAGGTVRHVASVGPTGLRDIPDLAELCEEQDRSWDRELEPGEPPPGLEPDTTLFVKDGCTLSTNLLATRANLHLEVALQVRNTSKDPAARTELLNRCGKVDTPCLVVGTQHISQPNSLMRYLAERTTDLPSRAPGLR